jgi:hypothetical protein
MSELHRVHVSIPLQVDLELWCARCSGPLLVYYERQEWPGGLDRAILSVEPCSHCISRGIADLVEAGEIKVEDGKIRRTT